MDVRVLDDGRDVNGGYKVDVSRGERVGRVSSEWFNRPDDERFLSLDDLFAQVKARVEGSRTRAVESAAIRVEVRRDNPEGPGFVLPGAEAPVAPTHFPPSSAHPPPICASCPRRWPASTFSTG
jgi:hypothetical protein